MSDRRTIEVEDDSVESATAAALAQLGVSRDQAKIEVISEAARGLLGFRSRKARVRVSVIEAPTAAPAAPPPPAPAPVAAEAPARDRAPQEAPPAAEEERDERPSRSAEEERPPAPPLDDATVERARVLLQEIVSLSGFPANVSARNDGDHATLEILDDDSGLLIGRKGQTLDAFEYIVSRALGRDEERSVHVTVDCQGYRGRREEAVKELALRKADEVRSRRRPVKLEDLSPRERRIVHLVLKDATDVTTRSSGEGHLRTLVIAPGGGRRPRNRG